MVGGLFSATVNAHLVYVNERPNIADEVGYIFGGVNVLIGIIRIADGDTSTYNLTFAISHFVIGAADIGLAIWSSQQPGRQEQKLTLTPTIMPDVQGRPAVGVGLRLVGW